MNGNPTDQLAREALESIFHRYINTNATTTDDTLDALRVRCEQRVAAGRERIISELEQQGIQGDEKLTTIQDSDFEIFKENIKDYQTLVHTNSAAIGDACKAVLSWMDEYVKKNKTMALPVERHFGNLTRFEEMIVSEIAVLEAVFDVETCHMEVLLTRAAAHQVYSRTGMHCHCLLLGPPGIGKSFCLELLRDSLIPDSWQELAYQSLKANAAPGNKRDMYVLIFEEVPPTMLGSTPFFNSNKHGVGTAGTETTDGGAFIKTVLTTGKMNFSVKTVAEDGTHISKTYHVNCSATFFFAGNFLESTLGTPMRSRLNVMTHQVKKREDSVSPLVKNQRPTTDETKRKKEAYNLRCRRTQALIMHLTFMIECGLLPRVDMTVANSIYLSTLALGQQKGLHD